MDRQTCGAFLSQGRELIQCNRPAAFGYRWGTDPRAVCCEQCRDALEAGAARMGRALHVWTLYPVETGALTLAEVLAAPERRTAGAERRRVPVRAVGAK